MCVYCVVSEMVVPGSSCVAGGQAQILFNQGPGSSGSIGQSLKKFEWDDDVMWVGNNWGSGVEVRENQGDGEATAGGAV